MPKDIMRPTDRTGLAIFLSLVALTLFDAMGLVIKHLSGTYSAAELSAWRNLFGLIPAIIALVAARSWHAAGRILRIRQWKLGFMRGVIVTFAQLFFYMSLGRMEFATASTITYANALFMTALAVPVLGEQVGWVRWSAVMIGFVGVILVMQPGSDTFSFDALLPLGAACFYALAGVTARRMDDDVPSALVSLYSSVAAAFGALILALLLGGFTPVQSKTDMAWIIAMGGVRRHGCFVPRHKLPHDRTKQPCPIQLLWHPAGLWAGLVVFWRGPLAGTVSRRVPDCARRLAYHLARTRFAQSAK